MPVAPGTKLGQYEVQDFIGQGAMGLVYRAYHTELERTGAVKVMQAITPDDDTVARFRHEAQAIAKLRHPNIVDVYDFGEYQGTPYMIVEYVPGGSLAGRMNGRRLDQATALKYLRGIASGLDYAHEHGIVHRDVKPANVLLTADDSPVLADFGLAKLLQGSSLKSMTGVTTGTPAYMAPEQVTGSSVGPASDRYSLATIAYEMLTGVIPFDGEALMELLYAQVHRQPPSPSSREASLGPAVDAVVMRGLSKDPAARWSSCAAFVDALDAALKGVAPAPAVAKTMVMAPPVVASTVPLVAAAVVAERVATAPLPGTVAVAFPGATAAEVIAPQAKRRSRKRLIAMIAAAAIVLLILGSLGLIALAAPTLSLSSSTVSPGENVVVSATRVPANTNGQIQLWSVLHTFGFLSDSSGNVAVDMTVPRDIGLGDHLVKLCYNSTCHAQATLHVVSRVALASPTPLANATPGTTPSLSPTPGVSPTPGSTPRPTSTPPATSTPKSTSTPSPTPAATPVITISNYYIKMLTGTEIVSGFHFGPGSTVTITFIQSPLTNKVMGSTQVSSAGSFSFSFTVPSTAIAGSAHIKVCGTVNSCYDATVMVTT